MMAVSGRERVGLGEEGGGAQARELSVPCRHGLMGIAESIRGTASQLVWCGAGVEAVVGMVDEV